MMTLEKILQRIAKACENVGRSPKSVRLIAVSKGQPIEKIMEGQHAGQIAFGENYGQELVSKAVALKASKIEWHFLGHLQTNKIKLVLPHLAWIHSLNSIKLAEGIEKRGIQKIKALLEINMGNEISKRGLSRKEVFDLLPQLNRFQKVEVCGLMTMPPFSRDPEKSRPHFRHLFELLKEINSRYLYRAELTELSMGMSGDFEIAIAEGATMVRIGEAIFGNRGKK